MQLSLVLQRATLLQQLQNQGTRGPQRMETQREVDVGSVIHGDENQLTFMGCSQGVAFKSDTKYSRSSSTDPPRTHSL
jgi:hypothetical protein